MACFGHTSGHTHTVLPFERKALLSCFIKRTIYRSFWLRAIAPMRLMKCIHEMWQQARMWLVRMNLCTEGQKQVQAVSRLVKADHRDSGLATWILMDSQ